MNIRKFIIMLASCVVSSAALANWSGLYVGGFAGGSTGAHVTSTEPLRLDNRTNWFRPFHKSFSYNTEPSFIGGLTLGYNLQIPKTPCLLGLEGEYGYLNLRGSRMDPNQLPYAMLPNNNIKNNSRSVLNIGNSYGYALVGGRIGYALNCLLFYVKSGAVFTNIQSKYNSLKTDPTSPTGLATLNISGNNNISGYGVGGGVEYVLPFKELSNISTKFEYLYLGLNKTQYTYGHCSCHFLWRTIEHISRINTFKVGMNYKFG